MFASSLPFTALATRPGILLNDADLAQLRQAVAEKSEPTFTAWGQVKTAADLALAREPQVPTEWYVPGFYSDKEGHNRAKEGLMKDANDAYALALAYHVLGDEKYAIHARKFVMAWAAMENARKEDDSMLSFSYHFPPVVFAADLLRGSPSFSEADDQKFAAFLENIALPLNTMNRSNNWGNWGLLLYASIASYRNDTASLKVAEKRWKEFIDSQIAEDGGMPHELKRNNGRSGIWYSNFSIMPQTLAAEVLRMRGMDLYDYVSPRGRTLRSAYEKIAPWCLHPESFPFWKGDPKELHGADYVSYFELLIPRWPNPDAETLVRKLRPMTARHGLPFLTFTHGRPMPAVN